MLHLGADYAELALTPSYVYAIALERGLLRTFQSEYFKLPLPPPPKQSTYCMHHDRRRRHHRRREVNREKPKRWRGIRRLITFAANAPLEKPLKIEGFFRRRHFIKYS